MQPILKTELLNKRFGAVTAADDISVNIENGSVVGLIGSNGAGKTTFLNMITGYLKPSSGDIFFNNKKITNFSPRKITRMGICRSFQVPQLFDNLTVLENLEVANNIASSNMSLDSTKISHEENFLHESVESLVDKFFLKNYKNQVTGTLPEGIRKLLDIAMTMLIKPKVLLLDEPTSGVSAEEKFTIMDLVMDVVQQSNITVLFVEHDMEIIQKYTSRTLAFFSGKIIAEGSTSDVLSNTDVKKYIIGGISNHSPKGS